MNGESCQQIIAVLEKCKRVVITTHVRPDGDAIGSCAAMALGLRKKGIEAEVLLLSHLPRKYTFLFTDDGVVWRDVENGWPEGFSLEGCDALVVVDTGTWSQLPGLFERIKEWKGKKVVIDHHLTQENWADVKLVVKEAAAAGEIVAEVLEGWGVKYDAAIAQALYVAIATDTGWFQFSNTRPGTHRLAARLMECGVNTDRIYQAVYQSEKPQRLLLQTRAQDSLELMLGDRLAVMSLSKRDFEETGATMGDTENMINIPLQIATVEVSILAVEPKNGEPVRISLRSKGQVDVAKFAEGFGGGGHARASGLKMEMSFAEAKTRVVEAMLERMR